MNSYYKQAGGGEARIEAREAEREMREEEKREVREEEREVREEDYRQLANKMRDLLRRKQKRVLKRTPYETSSQFDERCEEVATALISEYDPKFFEGWDSRERRIRMKSLKKYYNEEYSSLRFIDKIGAFIGAGAGKKKKPKGSKKKGPSKKGHSKKGHSKKGSKGSKKGSKKGQGGGKSRKPKKAKQTRKRPKKSRSRRPKKMKRSKRAGAAGEGDNPYPSMFRKYAYDNTYVK